MSWGRRRPVGVEGFTLVELLVVLMLIGIIGGIVSVTIARGLRADSQAQSRIEAFEDMQIALERMSREIRAAQPVEIADPQEIEVWVLRTSNCFIYNYQVDGTDLIATEQRSPDEDCNNAGGASSSVLVRDLDSSVDIFEYLDVEGGNVAVNPASVRISLVRDLPLGQRPVEVTTQVGLRNG